jgi:putative NADPH-quinone reductase
VVLAHPLGQCLAGHLAGVLCARAAALGWEVRLRDLYAAEFDPRLTAAERAGYYGAFAGEAAEEMAELAWAEVVVLVFPTWWFGFPAVLKGWFDRVWAPGVAYDHSPELKMMQPRLTGLKAVLAVTTLGAPAIWDWLAMGRPVRRVLKRGIVKPCAPGARVLWHALYRAEKVEPARLARFEARVLADLAALARRLG